MSQDRLHPLRHVLHEATLPSGSLLPQVSRLTAEFDEEFQAISDAREGPKAAVRATLNATQWQRCQFLLQQNARVHIPNLAMRFQIDADIGSVFDAPDRARAEASPAHIPLAVARGTRVKC